MGLHQGRITIDQARAFVRAESTGSYALAAAESSATAGPFGNAKSVRANIERLAQSLGRDSLVKGSTRDLVELSSVGLEVLPLVKAYVNAYDELALAPHAVRFCAYPSAIANLMQADSTLLEGKDAVLVLHDIADRHRRSRGLQLMQKLREREVDLVVAPTQAVSGHVEHEVVYTWSLRAVLPPGVLSDKAVTLGTLLDQPLACAPAGHTSRTLLEEAAFQLGKQPRVLIESTDPHALRAVAQASEGIVAVLPDDAFGAPDPNLGPQLLVEGQPLEGSFSVVRNRGGVEQRRKVIEAAAVRVATALKAPARTQGGRR